MLEPIIQPFVWGRGGRRMTPEEIARERELADQMGTRAGDTSPVGHWLQGAARVGDAIGSVIADKRADAAERQNADQDKTALTGLLGLLGGGSTMSPTTANVASALVPSDGGMPAQTAMVEGQPPIPGLQRAPSALPASFLAAVDRTEGAGGYDTLFGHAQKGKFAGTDISAMPIRDVIAFTDPSGPYAQSVKSQIGRVATPVGRYQVVGTTLRNAVSELGLDPNTPFNAATQDMVAKHLATRRIANAGSLPQKISALRSEWEGFKGVPDDQMAQIVADLEGGAAMSAQPGAAATASVPMSGAATAYVDPYVSVQPSSAAAQPAPATPAPVPAPAASGGIMDAIAPPMSEGYFPPAPSAPQAGAIDPAVIEALSSPYASPQTKQVASMLLERTMSQQQQAQERALQEQQRAQEIQQRQAIAQQYGIDPSLVPLDEAWKLGLETAINPRDRATVTVGDTVYDANTMQPIIQGQTPTGTMKEYDAYRADELAAGRQPLGRLDYEQALRLSGATSVNNILGGGKFGDKSAELAATRMDTIVNEGRQASSLMGDLQNLAEIGTQIQTGKGAEAMLALGPYAQALGIDVSEELEPLQAYQSIIDRLAPQMRVPGAGASSDFDAKQFLSSLPSAGRLPGGNEVINLTMQSVQQVKLEAANIARQALRGDMTWQEAEDKIAELPNPYAQFKSWQRENKTAAPSGVRQGGAAAPAENPLPPQTNKAKTGVTWEILD